MALRWTAAGLLEAQKTFRRLKAYRQLPILQNALQEHLRKAQALKPKPYSKDHRTTGSWGNLYQMQRDRSVIWENLFFRRHGRGAALD